MNVDDFDMAFLLLTGKKINWSLFKNPTIKQTEDIIKWGPEHRLAYSLLISSHHKYFNSHYKKIRKAFDLRGDISVDSAKAFKAVEDSYTDGIKIFDFSKKRLRVILNSTIDRSLSFFKEQASRTDIKKQERSGLDILYAEAALDHIKDFSEKYPERILHPEIKRLIELVETNPRQRLIDKAGLTERIENIASKGDDYFKNMSDIEVGRTWVATGLETAFQNDVEEYMIIAQMDDENQPCLPCQILHGNTFSVEKSRGILLQASAIDDPSEMGEKHPFPRFQELTKPDMTPEKIHNSDYVPPFHPRCRCDIIFLWSKTEIEMPESPQFEELDRIAHEIEDKAIEHAYVVSPSGETVFSKEGGKDYVDFTDEEAAMMRGQGMIHNHPKNGGSFGKDDITCLYDTGIIEGRVVGKKYIHDLFIDPDYIVDIKIEDGSFIFNSTEDEKKFLKNKKELLTAYEEAYNKVYSDFQEKIYAGTISIDYAVKETDHLVLEEMSKHVPWIKYNRRRI